ncbi:MAG: NAD(+) kinase [Psychromonas sp.]|nr:NAD(+) kinase [Psychromonas sp.]
MKTSSFKTIGLIGKPQHKKASQTMRECYAFLKEKGFKVIVDERVRRDVEIKGMLFDNVIGIGRLCDLAIVIGGDGNMLGAARILARDDIAVIGVNRGNLGFLTDLSPDNFKAPLLQVLEGNYQSEERFLLDVEIYSHGQLKSANSAVNEAILHPAKIAKMIEFAIYVDDNFMINQRSDGIIISTPTGSTAYSLSAGGPILTPKLNVLSLLSMYPHTLNSRPIVIDADSNICIEISQSNDIEMQVSCDSHVNLSVLSGDRVLIRKTKHSLKLVHPEHYSYFHVLQKKLGWGNKLY